MTILTGMKNQPLVSVITGYYNRERNLVESIESILGQSYNNFEFVVFDDCSTDKTSDLLSSFNDDRLVLARYPTNLGYTKGMIKAMSLAKGEFIAIHGAGDISFEHRIAKQVAYFCDRPDASIVGCLVEDIHDGKTTVHSPAADQGNFYFTHGEVMYRRADYDRVGGYVSLFKYGQFTHLKQQLLNIGNGGFVDEVLYRRIHFGDGVTKNSKNSLEQKICTNIGKQLVDRGGIWCLDTPLAINRACLMEIDNVLGTEKEVMFANSLKRTGVRAYLAYRLFKAKVISKSVFMRCSYKFAT